MHKTYIAGAERTPHLSPIKLEEINFCPASTNGFHFAPYCCHFNTYQKLKYVLTNSVSTSNKCFNVNPVDPLNMINYTLTSSQLNTCTVTFLQTGNGFLDILFTCLLVVDWQAFTVWDNTNQCVTIISHTIPLQLNCDRHVTLKYYQSLTN